MTASRRPPRGRRGGSISAPASGPGDPVRPCPDDSGQCAQLRPSAHDGWPVSRQFFLTVLALWYSRAAFGRCYSGATCHTAGENTLKRSNRLVLLIGALLAVVAFVGIVLLLGQPSGGGGGSQPTPPTTVHVVKAKVAIPAGTIVTQDMLDATGELPIGAAQNAFQDPGLVISKTIRKDAQPGTILTFDYFIDTGQTSNVTDGLPLGLRAMAIQVDQVTGVGTLIHTGDKVDLVIGLKIQTTVFDPADKTKTKILKVGDPAPSVKMIIQNLRVLGTLLPPPTAQAQQQQQQPGASPSPGVQQQPATTLNGQQEIVVVAVTANQAEAIRYAQLYTDPMALVLRSPKDYVAVDASGSPIVSASPVVPPFEQTDGMVLRILVDKYGVLPPNLLVGSSK
ncbi:MAG: Flp pilus assembly protein CpaB [Chloroflexi bacterium]|nr:MAG: Flp pilus assembly protein CpaB [Chloroflexota bacterium]